MRKGTKILAGISLALLSLGITFYPLISNYFAEFNRSLVETKYTKAVQLMDDDGVNEARMAAQEYNETLLSGAYKPYTKEALSQAAEGYNDLLNIRGDGIMGYIEIPKLGVELPVFHGTEEETLDRGLGHLLGSSLPVGGIGTHCVITGHSGLAGQRMFSDGLRGRGYQHCPPRGYLKTDGRPAWRSCDARNLHTLWDQHPSAAGMWDPDRL